MSPFPLAEQVLVAAPNHDPARRYAECAHELGGLPCVNRAPHAGRDHGCVHHSESGVPDRHDDDADCD